MKKGSSLKLSQKRNLILPALHYQIDVEKLVYVQIDTRCMAAKKDQDDAEEDEAQVALLVVAPCRAESLNFGGLH